MTITITPATKVANNNSIFVNKPAKRILSNIYSTAITKNIHWAKGTPPFFTYYNKILHFTTYV